MSRCQVLELYCSGFLSIGCRLVSWPSSLCGLCRGEASEMGFATERGAAVHFQTEPALNLLTKLGLSLRSSGSLIPSVAGICRKEVFVCGIWKSNRLNNHNRLLSNWKLGGVSSPSEAFSALSSAWSHFASPHSSLASFFPNHNVSENLLFESFGDFWII